MDERRSTPGIWIAVAGLLLLFLPVLYVLSVGPVAAVYPDEAPPWAEVFYAPIFWLCDNSDFAAHALELYLELWGVP